MATIPIDPATGQEAPTCREDDDIPIEEWLKRQAEKQHRAWTDRLERERDEARQQRDEARDDLARILAADDVDSVDECIRRTKQNAIEVANLLRQLGEARAKVERLTRFRDAILDGVETTYPTDDFRVVGLDDDAMRAVEAERLRRGPGYGE